MSENADFRFEVLKYQPWIANPKTWPIELPAAMLAGFGSINRATERDLLSFKTGDLTLSFRNADGFFDDLFAFMTPKTRYQLRVYRRNVIQFWGVILGIGSIIYDRTEKTCEITAYGLNRQLVDTSAGGLTRGICTTLPNGAALHDTLLMVGSVGGMNVFDDLHISDGAFTQVTEISQIFYPDTIRVTILMGTDYAPGAQITRVCGFMKVATATATQTTLTLQDPGDGTNATAGLLTGDVLHITDQVNSEDVTVKQVTSATVVSLESALVNSYAAASPVTITTPFYRYKTVDYLVRELFKAAGFGVVDLRLNQSQFRRPAPTPVNVSGLDLSHYVYTNPAQKDGKLFITEETVGTYSQTTPDAAWTNEDATVKAWVDWSRYYTEAEAAPTVYLRAHQAGVAGADDPHCCGYDYRPVTKTVYMMNGGKIKFRTTTDGTTYGALTDLVVLPAAFPSTALPGNSLELDPVRQYIYCYGAINGGAQEFQVYDIGGAAFTDLKQSDDTGFSYFAPVYVPEGDYVLALRGQNVLGPVFQIAAFRGKSRLWVRPFPNVLVKQEGSSNYLLPTHTMRLVGGQLCAMCVSDGVSQFIVSKDEFRSYVMGQVNTGGTLRAYGARILGYYRYFTYAGTAPRGYGIAAPFYAGVVNYFDMEDKSASDGLKELSEMTNALFFIDDEGGGHFVARDLYDSGNVLEIAPRIKTRRDVQLWDQIASFVEVSGPDDSAVAGDKAFAASGLTIDSPIVPNEAFAQASASDYLDFYGKTRAQLEVTVQDLDGHIYQPMDRVTIDSMRYLVYESDHDLVNDEVRLTLLEDA